MNKKPIYAEDVDICPNCGSKEFFLNWIRWDTEDNYDELAGIVCRVCGASYYTTDYYYRYYGLPQTDKEHS